jgi:hypothetical protein
LQHSTGQLEGEEEVQSSEFKVQSSKFKGNPELEILNSKLKTNIH